MKFRAEVEPPEPMRGLEVPPEVVESLGSGKRPRVKVTINDHTWSTRIAIMRGRNLIGLSKANRSAAGVAVGDEVEVQVEVDDEPMTVEEPEDFAAALAADAAARAAYDGLTVSQKRQHVREIESAKKSETRQRRIGKTIQELRTKDPGPFFHGTKADLQPGDLLAPGYSSNYGQRVTANFIYFAATLNAATWGAELASGDGPGRIYRVEPTGAFEDDPNLTDQRFLGNPTRSYRTRDPLRIAGEVEDWEPHSAEELQQMRDHLEELERQEVEAINE